MKQILIFIFCMYSLNLSAQNKIAQNTITNINSDRLPSEVKMSLQNLSLEQIESFKQKGEFKTQTITTSLKFKYALKIEDNVLTGSIESDNISIPVRISMIWHCDHDPQHIATSRDQLRKNIEKYNCKNWSSN